jgi:hypothetical protein
VLAIGALALCALVGDDALAHGIGGKDAQFVAATRGADILPFSILAPSTW